MGTEHPKDRKQQHIDVGHELVLRKDSRVASIFDICLQAHSSQVGVRSILASLQAKSVTDKIRYNNVIHYI